MTAQHGKDSQGVSTVEIDVSIADGHHDDDLIFRRAAHNLDSILARTGQISKTELNQYLDIENSQP